MKLSEFKNIIKQAIREEIRESLFDKKGLERVATSLPQTDEEPVEEDCGCGEVVESQLNEWRAEEVLQQLGGNRFIAMTGAKNFVKNDPKKQITFKLGRGAKNGINYIRITLTSMDLYNMEFIKARGTDIKVVVEKDGIYNDQLQDVFTQVTGLYTRL